MSRIHIAAIAAACLALPAQAHVTLEKPEANAGQPYKGVLRIGHGCAGSPTVSLSVEIPDGLVAVKPMPKAGWTLQTEQGAYPQAVTVYGQTLTSGTRRITWSGGRLLESEYDEFVFVGHMAPGVAGPVYLPAIQGCETGENRWVEVPKTGQTARDLTYPAAILRVAASETRATQSGPLRIEQAWSRATPGGASVGAGYLRLTNTGSTSERLLGGATDIAARIETHDMKVEDGVMKMRALPQGIEIAPGATVDLRPGGLHLMIMGLKQGLKTGETVSARLQFEKAGTVPVTFNVLAMGAPAPGPVASEPEMDHSKHMMAR
jgi:copper(I)-binding protein